MTEKRNTADRARAPRDAFTFSLRGLTTVAAFAPVPAIAGDRIRKRVDQGARGCANPLPAAPTGREGERRRAA